MDRFEIKKLENEHEFLGYINLLSSEFEYLKNTFGSNYYAIENNQHILILVVKNRVGELIGGATLAFSYRVTGGKSCTLEDVVISKEIRGQGVGTQLISKCIEYARDNGAFKLSAECRPDRVGFYNCSGLTESSILVKRILNE